MTWEPGTVVRHVAGGSRLVVVDVDPTSDRVKVTLASDPTLPPWYEGRIRLERIRGAKPVPFE